MIQSQSAELHPLKTCKIENGDVNLFCEHMEKAIYNNDDTRINLHEFDHQFNPDFVAIITKQAKSVACMIEQNYLVEDSNKTYSFSCNPPSLAEAIAVRKGYDFGEEEKFRDEPVPALWTGFLIEKNILLTAAHCVCEPQSNRLSSKIASMRIVFGFQMIDSKNCRKTFEEKDVYHIKSVIDHNWTRENSYYDWALLELDRDVVGRSPLKLDFSKMNAGYLYMLGYPSGLPLKFAGQARVVKAEHPHVIESDLCAFAGNSGSPIFRMDTKEVVAILLGGNTDYTVDHDYKGKGLAKSRVSYVTSVNQGAEICQRIGVLDRVKEIINDSLGLFKSFNGLNFSTTCSSVGCSTHGKPSFIHKGLGTFNVGKEFYESICEYCRKTPEITIQLIFLKNCSFKYIGIDKNKEKVEKEDFTEDPIVLNLQGWKFFEIEVKNKLN